MHGGSPWSLKTAVMDCPQPTVDTQHSYVAGDDQTNKSQTSHGKQAETTETQASDSAVGTEACSCRPHWGHGTG